MNGNKKMLNGNNCKIQHFTFEKNLMVKYIITALTICNALFANAQKTLVPAKNIIEKKWIKNQSYQMIWYGIRDTAKMEIGKVNTSISSDKNTITIVTQVSMKQMKTPWVDSTVADKSTLKPILHSSYNGQRDMVLNFGKIVTGFYNNKIKKKQTEIKDTTNEAYFDSNLYPTLITWLPLKEGYKQDISIYDYNPDAKIGVLKAFVKEVKKGAYESKNSGTRNVWIVTVADEIGNGENGVSTYYIDVLDRKVWKQQIDAGGRKMEMVLVEM
jgi:hypothetical protein